MSGGDALRARVPAPGALSAILLALAWGLATGAGAEIAGREPEADRRGVVGGEDGITTLPPLLVTATRVRRDPFDLPVALDQLGADRVQTQQPGVLVSESLRRVPGAVATHRGTFAQEEQIQIRGFGARAQFGTRGVRLFADGIPASTPDGQGGPGLFALGSAARIEVLRGTFSALHGNHSGGVVQIFTEDPPASPEASLRLMAGSEGTSILGARVAGPRNGEGGAAAVGSGRPDLGALLDTQRATTEGYRRWSRARKDQMNVKLRMDLPQDGALALVANWLDLPESLDPLGLTAAQVAEDRRQTQPAALAFRTRRSLNNDQIGLVLEQPLGETDRIAASVYAGGRDNTQYLAIPLTAQNAITASGGVSAFTRDFAGGRVWWSREGALLGRPWQMTTGAELDWSSEHRRGYENRLGARGALKRDERNEVSAWGAFAQTEWDLAARLSLSAGLRFTAVEFDSRDRFICTPEEITAPGPRPGTCSGTTTPVSATNQNPNDSGTRGYSAWTPALGLVYRLTPGANLYANLGRGFETPTLSELAYRPDGASGLNLALRSALSWQAEVGAKLGLGDGGQLTLALFQIETEDELSVATNQGGRASYQNTPASRRRGLELLIERPLGAGLSGTLAATWLDARWTEGFLACTATPCQTLPSPSDAPPLNAAQVQAGNRIPGVAPFTLFAELAYEEPSSGFTAAIALYGQGAVEVDDLNTESAAGFWTLGIRLGLTRRWRGLELAPFARIDNLLGEEYIGAVIVNDANGRYYAPAAETSYLLGLSVRWGG